MDQKKLKSCDSAFPGSDFLVNNPNITIIPMKYANAIQSTSSTKQRPVPSVSGVSRIVPVSCKPIVDQTIIKSSEVPKETKNNSKRVASNQISNRPVKLSRMSNTKSSNISSLQEQSVQDCTITRTPGTDLNNNDTVLLISDDDEEADMQPNKKPVVTKRVIYDELKLTNPRIDGKPAPDICIADYKKLTIERYVNDVLINFYLKYAYYRKLSVEDQERTHVFDTFLYASLTRDSKTNKGYMTKKVNIFEKDFVVVPINENAHWFMAVICFPYLICPVYMDDGTPVPEEKWDHLDQSSSWNSFSHGEDIKHFEEALSKKSGIDYETYVKNLTKINGRPIKQPCILIFDSLCGGIQRTSVVARLRRWLEQEYRRKYNGAERDFSPNVVKGGLVKVPQQNNLFDCGLFLMEYFEKFYERPILDYKFPINHLGNWFHPGVVSSNCQKRIEVQSVILNLMNEQGVVLPPGYNLPVINFGPKEFLIPENQSVQPREKKKEIYNDHVENDQKQQLKYYQRQTFYSNNRLTYRHTPNQQLP